MHKIKVRTGMPSIQLTRREFETRMREKFYDPVFEKLGSQLDAIVEAAWHCYDDYHKSPRTRRAGKGFADPDFELPLEWLAARDAIRKAERRHRRRSGPGRILLVNGSSRSDWTCPGEMSKSYRLAMIARDVFEEVHGIEVDFLDLSRLVSEYGRTIHPCKACVSTAQPLCHWPCSCYPNHALGQTNDWMAEIYPQWVAAHGVMIVCPVNWYQAPSTLKLMIDRLVCADGGNPDPTSTGGKNPGRAKALEMEGWPYPRHLAGRVFGLVVHGDDAGTENLRRMLSDWMSDIGMIPAGHMASIDRYIGYYQPYATSHEALDRDHDLQEEVRNAARTLIAAVRLRRAGKLPKPDEGLSEPRPK
ncbi:MAG: flavodoxin family protein [Dongiaceae bacterium]